MNEPWQSRITIEPGKCGGRPCIRGMHITVYDVLSYLAAGMTVAEVIDDFPYLTPEDIQACLAFAAERERSRYAKLGSAVMAMRATIFRWVRLIAKTLLIFYLLLVLVFYFLQTALIFPGSWGQGKAEAQVVVPAGTELISLTTADGQHVKALFGPALTTSGAANGDARRPTILYFYGNGMSLSACAGEFAAFRRLGANVLIPEYVGYGLSSGRPSEDGCYATATAAYDWLAHDSRVDPTKIIVGGWSLGAAVAIDLAARQPMAGLFACSAFTSMRDAGQRLYPFLPVNLLLKHRFMSDEKIPHIKCPTILAHGRQDTLVPFSMCGELARVAGGPVTQIPIDGAGHNDFWDVGYRQVFRELKMLIDQVAAQGK